jgi:plasmid stabilization system protein ParE
MKLDVVLTPRAKETFIATILLIQDKWGDTSAEKFVERTYQVLDSIAQQPYLFKAYGDENVRKGLITKQTSVIYRVASDRIEVLFFWDNRQDLYSIYLDDQFTRRNAAQRQIETRFTQSETP